MRLKNKHITIILLFISSAIMAQQEGQLSLYAFNPLSVNPAYTGSKGVLGAIVSARTQWTSFQGSPKNSNLSIQTPLKKEQHSIGFRLSNEQNFFNQKTEAVACYAYRFKLLNGKLALGLTGGITNVNFNWTTLELKDKNDIYANASSQKSSHILPKLDAGAYYNDESSFIGISGTQLIKENVSAKDYQQYNGNLNTHLYFVASKAFMFNDVYTLNPTLNCKWTKGNLPLVDLSIFNRFYNCFWIGIGARSNYSAMFMAQAIINKQIKIGYSFDYFPYKKLMTSYPTHEIMLSYDLKLKSTGAVSFRYF